ncbi:aldehyde dehydrogenase family protein [Gulosibacter chungangensis]|uniref:Aldehyde dehydrogenase family protein n=1 Tax=Gulosibacter chungangensis TaxID=979746 RepID=A0A7J5BDK2_9MICO|nr:aldehyde dehydrogenase family protein [Gulosibacter chungangensis]KAB1644229.1 aldehyde dehydrogenase family protein [Gulosibacter chungangensis]
MTQARHDVNRTIANFEFFADHARVSESHAYPSDTGHHQYVRYDSVGVVVAIAPWNFPLMLESWKVAPALAWGNTVVLKPSEDSPATATMLGRLAIEAGFPEGVLNVVQGAGATGGYLTADTRVDRITFTGSSATGKIIGKIAMDNLTPVSLELGGKGANIVFDDADLDNAVHWSIQAIYRNAGQVCLAGSRLFVQRGIYDEFIKRFVAAAEDLKQGDPSKDDTEYGPLASRKHFEKVTSYLATVEENGGTVLTGGKAGEGLFVEPTALTDLGTDSPHYREEIFGPVVVVTQFDTEAEALALANGTPYGLNAIAFTENLSRAHRVAAKLKAGTVWINTFFIRDLRAPFGGVGDSGVGREGGQYSREFFTEPKAVVMQIHMEG